MYGSAEAGVYVMMFSLITFISNGSWKLECALRGGAVMTMRSVGTECETLGRRLERGRGGSVVITKGVCGNL